MVNIITKEIKEMLQDKKIVMMTVLVLIILIIGTSYHIKNRIEEEEAGELLSVGIINKDNSAYSDQLIAYFEASETFSRFFHVRMGQEDELKDAFYRDELDLYIEIPEEFAKNMRYMNHIPINVIMNIQDTTMALLVRTVLEGYEKYISAVEVNAVALYQLMEEEGMPPEQIDETNVRVSLDLIFTALGKEQYFNFIQVDTYPPTGLLEYYLIVIVIITALYAGLDTGFRLLSEVGLGTYARMMTTQTGKISFFMGKLCIMYVFLTGFTFGSFSMIRGEMTSKLFLYSTVISLFSLTGAMLMSSFFHKPQSFILAGNLLIFLFTIMGGGIIPLMFLPQKILTLSRITPFYYMIEGMLQMNQVGRKEPNYIILYFLISSLLFLAVTVMMYGRRRLIREE